MNGQQGQQSSIKNVFSRSFSGNSLFEVSLVKDTNPELPFYKPRYFFFLSMSPGEMNQQNQRTYNRQNRLTLKTDVEKLYSLAHAIRAHARGQGENFGKFAIFADPSRTGYQQGNQGYKICFPSTFGQNNENVSISFKQGQEGKPFGVVFTRAEAMGTADMLEFMAQKAFELEFNERTLEVGTQSQGGGVQNDPFQGSPQQPSQPQQGGGPQQQVQNDFQSGMSANTGQDDNSGGGSPFVEDAPF